MTGMCRKNEFAVILPESGDNRWNSLIKGMKQSAKLNNLHMIICNTDEIENAEMEKEIIKRAEAQQYRCIYHMSGTGK